jgi:hypothetical protein
MAIKISCPNCDRHYNLVDDMGGNKIRCKDCEHVFAVPRAEQASRSEVVTTSVSRKAAPPDDAEDDDRPRRRDRDEEDDRPRKKRKKRGAPLALILGIGVGAVVVVTLVLGLVLLLGGKLTRENAARLNTNMTESEVIALIGSPHRTATKNGGALGESRTLV